MPDRDNDGRAKPDQDALNLTWTRQPRSGRFRFLPRGRPVPAPHGANGKSTFPQVILCLLNTGDEKQSGCTIRPIVSEVLANETLHLLLEKLESEETTRERNECLVRIYEDASDYTNDTFAYPIWPRLLRLVDLGTFSTTVLTRRSHATFTCSRGTYSLGFPLDCGDNASGTAGRRADGTSTPSGRGNHGEGGSRC